MPAKTPPSSPGPAVGRILLFGSLFSLLRILSLLLVGRGGRALLTDPRALPLGALLLLTALGKRRNRPGSRALPVLLLTAYAFAALLRRWDSFYGYGLLIGAAALALSYGFFRRAGLTKLSLGLLFILLAIGRAAGEEGAPSWAEAAEAGLFLLFFLSFTGAVYREKIRALARGEAELIRLRRELDEKERALRRREEETASRGKRLERREKRLYGDEGKRDAPALSPKETEVLRELCHTRGSNKEIAARLGIAPGTVKQHMSRIFKKAGIKNRSQLLLLYREEFPEEEAAYLSRKIT